MGHFQKATKKKAKLRLALFGASGSGKTYTALRIATGMGGRIALIDTESGSASKYSDRFAFDAVTLTKASVDNYVALISEAAKEGYNTLIIDSLSHGWAELLEEIEKLTQNKYKGNSFRAWGEGSPKQRKLIDSITNSGMHIIATMRCKTEYVLELNEKGKQVPRAIATVPEQGKGIEYEFDMLIQIDFSHNGEVKKDRTGKFQDAIIDKPDENFGKELMDWLSDGEDIPVNVADITPEPEQSPITEAMKTTLTELILSRDIPDDERMGFEDTALAVFEEESVVNYNQLLARISKKKAKQSATELQLEITAIIQQMIKNKIAGFEVETRMRNSFDKHLGTRSLKECFDVAKLKAYKEHLIKKGEPNA